MNYAQGPWTDAVVDFSTAGDNIVVAGSSTSETHILSLSIVAVGGTTLTIGFGSTPVGKFTLAAGQSINLSGLANQAGAPYFIVPRGVDFIINSSAAVAVTGTVKWARAQP